MTTRHLFQAGVLLAEFAILFARSSFALEKSKKVIGYYHIHSASNGYAPADIPAELVTHAIFSFIGVSANGECQPVHEAGAKPGTTESLLLQFKALKRLRPHMKTMYSIGGAENSGRISDAASSSESREKFVRSCVVLMRQYDFDGIDLDWEFPVTGLRPGDGKRPEDKANLVKLLHEFRRRMPKGAVLSAAVAADKDYENIDISGMARYLDWFGVMIYDYCMTRAKVTCHQSRYEPRYPGQSSGRVAMQWYLDHGARRDQLVLGVPFYGVSWPVQLVKNRGIDQIIDHSSGLRSAVLSYREIQEHYLNRPDYTLAWDDQAQEPVIYSEKNKEVISFDNEQSLTIKARLTKNSDFAGVMIWELENDEKNHSLLKALNIGLNSPP